MCTLDNGRGGIATSAPQATNSSPNHIPYPFQTQIRPLKVNVPIISHLSKWQLYWIVVKIVETSQSIYYVDLKEFLPGRGG